MKHEDGHDIHLRPRHTAVLAGLSRVTFIQIDRKLYLFFIPFLGDVAKNNYICGEIRSILCYGKIH